MKKLSILLSLVAILSIASFTAKAQVSATATSSATIITPIAITKTADLNFGNVAVSPTLAGTVVITPAGVRSAVGGVTLPAIAGTVSAPSFTVTGAAGSTYSISLPAAFTITGAGAPMTIDSFVSTPTPSGLLTGGTQTLTVGATLHVGANQAAGVYTNATALTVTVNYN